MQTGSSRFSRSLGFIPSLGASSELNQFERAVGINILTPEGGGLQVGAAPSTLLMMALGAAAGASINSGPFKGGPMWGGIKGAAMGVGLAALIKGAGRLNV